ncbi:UvrD-helicase domain-containing protein [Nocardia sp. NPDC127526]|uniref:UvrD-helicase domain-containing protein n=1 Tax=Nocardia sp. NPDC127526 TaxID=3345393 RepID=UPI003644BB64
MTPQAPIVELDDVQRAIVESPIEARLLVVAGAGQGKTEVVAARIGQLVAAEDLSASAEILVLSFSRAAVDAVRKRLDARAVAQANVRTFDSFANRLLVDADIEPKGDFDARIRQATKYLNETTERPYELDDLRHVVVDEIQDLVGDRADFVLAVLRTLDTQVGITALGDPLQAIYDFQLAKSKSRSTSADVFTALRSELGAHQVALYTNYRARGSDPKKIIGLGNRIRDLEDAEQAWELIREFDSTLLPLGDPADWAELLAGRATRTAVLCVSNAEVLRASRELHKLGVRHVVRRSAQEFGAARWIGPALNGFSRMDVTKDDVDEALSKLPHGVAPSDAWYLLKAAESGRNHNSLNLSRLRTVIRSGATPLALTEQDNAEVILSTIHRSKGLEFDRVFLVDPSYPSKSDDLWAAVRARYVALSRARDQVFSCNLAKNHAYWTEEYWLPGRILERVRNGTSKRTKTMEFCYADVAVDVPFGTRADAGILQGRLSEALFDGMDVEAHLDPERTAGVIPSFIFVAAADGTAIGRSSESFGTAFLKAFGLGGRPLPKKLTGLSVVSVETVAAEPRMTEQTGLGGSGMWLVPRIAGLVLPDWNSRESESE